MRLTKIITPENSLFFCVTLLFFVTPLSSSLKSIFLTASVAIVILTPAYRQQLINLLSEKFFITAIFLVIIAALGCLWSQANFSERILILEKWSKLLYLPCLVVALNNQRVRNMAINAFIIAMVFTCICSFYVKFTDLTLSDKMRPDGIFRNHIMTSMMTSFAAYLAGTLFLKSKNLLRILYLVSIFVTSVDIIFINESRTGYVIYLLLMLLLILQHTNKAKALFGIFLVCSTFISSCLLSPTFLDKVKQTKTELSSYQTDKNTSLGYRLQFHNFAENLFKEHPIIGNGTGSFTYKFRTENPVPAWTSAEFHSGRLLEPHSQYLLIAAEFGSLGLLAFLLFYAELVYRSYYLENMRNISLALFIILAIGNLTDSLLFYSGSGYFFIIFFALAFSENANSGLVIRSLYKLYKRPSQNFEKLKTSKS